MKKSTRYYTADELRRRYTDAELRRALRPMAPNTFDLAQLIEGFKSMAEAEDEALTTARSAHSQPVRAAQSRKPMTIRRLMSSSVSSERTTPKRRFCPED